MAKEVKKSNNKKDNKEKKTFLKEFKAELKRVSWPTTKQLINNTIAVLAIVLVISAIVFVLDVIFDKVVTTGVGQLKAIVTSSSTDTEETNTTENATDATSNEAEVTEGSTESVGETESDTTEESTVVNENQ